MSDIAENIATHVRLARQVGHKEASVKVADLRKLIDEIKCLREENKKLKAAETIYLFGPNCDVGDE